MSNNAEKITLGCHSERSSSEVKNPVRSSTGSFTSAQDDNCTFTLVGLDDWLAGKTDMEAALSPCVIASDLPAQAGAKQSHDLPAGKAGIATVAESIPTEASGLPRDDEKCDPKIVLIHNPDFILDPQSKNADLILAGNTHGGQIRLPFIGPVPRLPSKLPRAFDEGLFDITDFHPQQNVGPGLVPGRNGGAQSLALQDREKRRIFITSGISESGPRARLFNPPEIVILELY